MPQPTDPSNGYAYDAYGHGNSHAGGHQYYGQKYPFVLPPASKVVKSDHMTANQHPANVGSMSHHPSHNHNVTNPLAPPPKDTTYHPTVGQKGINMRREGIIGHTYGGGKAPVPHYLASHTPKAPKKKRKESFVLYIARILKQIHSDDLRISKTAIMIVDNFVIDFFERICDESLKLMIVHKRRTLTYREIETAAKLILTGELSHHAIREAQRAKDKFIYSRDSY